MRFLDFILKKKDPALITKLGLSELWEILSEEEIKKFRYYSEKVLSDNKIKINDFEEKTQVVIRSATSIEDPETHTAFIIRSAADFLTDIADIAILEADIDFAEKMLVKACEMGTNIYDLHYSYAKLVELYYGNLEKDGYYERCQQYCLKDIDIFEEIRKSSYNEYMTIAKRTYKAALITREEFSDLLDKIKNRLFLPVIPAFKILIELHFLKRNYVEALLLIEKALFYDMIEEEKNYFEEMLNEARNQLYDLQLEKEREREKAEEVKKDLEKTAVIQQKKVEENSIIEESISEDSKTVFIEEIKQEKVNEIKKPGTGLERKTRMYMEFIKTEEEIENGDFFQNNSIDKAKEKLIKIMSAWERGALETTPSHVIFFSLAELYYSEENDEKAQKIMTVFIRSMEKYSPNSIYLRQAKKLKALMENGLLRRDYIFVGPDTEEYKTLLSAANEEYKSGNYDKAAYTAKKAREIAEINNIIPNITEVLKLPMYLQKAKRYEEAWALYNNILEERDSGGSDNLEIAKIYDKMRIQLQNEKKYEKAIVYGILAYIYEKREYEKRGDLKKQNDMETIENMGSVFSLSLKRKKQEDKEQALIDYLKTVSNKESGAKADYQTLSADIYIILEYSENLDTIDETAE